MNVEVTRGYALSLSTSIYVAWMPLDLDDDVDDDVRAARIVASVGYVSWPLLLSIVTATLSAANGCAT